MPGTVYFTADQHFGHSNIIRYCHRPFQTVLEMNQAMIENWNRLVGPDDTVYQLGDLCMGNPHFWLHKLNGEKILVNGNHDHYGLPSIQFNGWLLIHDPARVPADWQGWAIHGHIHNNDLEHYPKLNREAKRVNLSVELWDYAPISLEKLEALLQ